MDFSSIPRVLDSLQRRQPPLQDTTLALITTLRNSNNKQEENDSSNSDAWLDALLQLLNVEPARWEPLAVGVYVATEVLLQQHQDDNAKQNRLVYVDGPRVPTIQKTESADVATTQYKAPQLTLEQKVQLCHVLHEQALLHLEHKEPRVRTLIAKAIAAYGLELPAAEGTSLRAALHDRLWTSVHHHIVTGREDGSYSRSSTGAMDDTTGWRALETNWQCLASLIKAMQGNYFVEFPLTQQFVDDCQFSCVTHVNRHVRAAGLNVLEQCVVAAADGHRELLRPGSMLREAIKTVLKAGLADNWSQVRMAASVLCRVLFTALLQDDADKDVHDLFVALLPRMCLNRFYMAQGVKLYSHDTWKMVFPQGGLDTLLKYLPAVVRYYVQMCDADNHVVREGACQAIAELAVQVGLPEEHRETLQPHVPVMLQALLMCFHDESWPVRDEACLACGTLCKSYPEECRPELKTLWERWTEQLTDQIWSVRQDAAVALGDAMDAYGQEVWLRLKDELIPKILPAARDQPAMSLSDYKAHVNDPQAHTNTQLYSCGSLAPKLKKGSSRKDGAGRVGCSSCGIDRPKSPWEATDGCIYLLRELCIKSSEENATSNAVPIKDDILIPLLSELADVCRVSHFPQAEDLRTTLFRQLPVMAQALGKQRFKRTYLDLFLDLLFRTVQSRSASQLAQHAARTCAAELALLIGPTIFRGRLQDDMHQELLDEILREYRQQQQHEQSLVSQGAAFSPFGPPGLLEGPQFR